MATFSANLRKMREFSTKSSEVVLVCDALNRPGVEIVLMKARFSLRLYVPSRPPLSNSNSGSRAIAGKSRHSCPVSIHFYTKLWIAMYVVQNPRTELWKSCFACELKPKRGRVVGRNPACRSFRRFSRLHLLLHMQANRVKNAF